MTIDVTSVLKNLKIDSLNEMQQSSLAAAEKGNDLILLSPTGTGKTLGFLLPVLKNLDPDKEGVQALIIVPSRELALQIEQVFRSMSTGFKVNSAYGGHMVKTEKNNFDQPPAVLVGTPGRLVHHIKIHSFDPLTIHTLVLDEFDKALEFGFQEDMSFIVTRLKKVKQKILTSATVSEIPSFINLRAPERLNFLTGEAPVRLELKLVRSGSKDKSEALLSLLCMLGNKHTIVFCNQKEIAEQVGRMLDIKGLSFGMFHGDVDQQERVRTLAKFRNGSVSLLIATDLAARGLDIPEIDYVVHYQLPVNESAWTHRNGRTARVAATGTAWMVLSSEEYVPEYIDKDSVQETPLIKANPPAPSLWTTLYFSLGKKDKINKIDIVGLLCQKGGLQKEEVGLIEVLDFCAYAAVRSDKARTVLSKLRNEKIKKQGVKIEMAK